MSVFKHCPDAVSQIRLGRGGGRESEGERGREGQGDREREILKLSDVRSTFEHYFKHLR